MKSVRDLRFCATRSTRPELLRASYGLNRYARSAAVYQTKHVSPPSVSQ